MPDGNSATATILVVDSLGIAKIGGKSQLSLTTDNSPSWLSNKQFQGVIINIELTKEPGEKFLFMTVPLGPAGTQYGNIFSPYVSDGKKVEVGTLTVCS
jgi:hypothetical protein